MKIIVFIKELIILLLIFIVVCLGWQLLEIIMIGHVNPNNVDTVIGIILTISLYKNLISNEKKTNAKN